MRTIIIDRNGDSQFRVRGTEQWSEFGDSWLCAHDLLHHLPFDGGTVAEEAMTYGAELWMNQSHSGVEAICGSSLEGVLLADEVLPEQLPRYELPEVPLNFRRPRAAYMERFATVVDCGVSGFIGGLQDRSAFSDLSDEWVERIAGDANKQRFVDWMAFGYRVAQRRFPDPDTAAILFSEIQAILSASPAGQPVTLRLNERDCSVEALG